MGKGATKAKRKAVEYERSVPRCANCISYERPRTVHIVGDHKTYILPWCTTNQFTTDPNGCCNVWEGTDGHTLEL